MEDRTCDNLGPIAQNSQESLTFRKFVQLPHTKHYTYNENNEISKYNQAFFFLLPPCFIENKGFYPC